MSDAGQLAVDPAEIERFVVALFAHAAPGTFVSLRCFRESETANGDWNSISAVRLGDDLAAPAKGATEVADFAAKETEPTVFCPPVCTFTNGHTAKENDIAQGLVLSVECDKHPTTARQRLEELLGPATCVVASGGEWTDEKTGAVVPKLHLHWRLSLPASGGDLARLKEARRLATKLVGGDPSNVPISHPLRWPGSVWRKQEPGKLCHIASLNMSTEIDLGQALEALRAVSGGPRTGTGNGADHHAGTASDGLSDLELIRQIMTGEAFHPALTPLAARLIGRGMFPGAVVDFERSLMEAIQEEKRDERWHARYADIPRIVETAEVKYSPAHAQSDWPEPRALPEGLLPVAPFTSDFLPFTLSNWVDDIAERMQCPPEFVAVTAVAALGAVLGRRIGVRPERHTDWVEVCSFWGCVVGRPGWLKSPAMAEAMRPLMRLEAEAQKENEKARRAYEQELELWNLKKKARERAATTTLKRDGNARIDFGDAKPEEPQPKRYITSDSTYEALGQLLVANPNGILVFRDELVSLLKTLDREEYVAARGFFLSAWSGKQPYTFDRVLRGHQHIPAAFVGLVGSSQPGRISEYLRRATSSAEGNDGLIQRFGLLVWPDASPQWRDTDRCPNTKAREAAWEVFERFSEVTALSVKAEHDSFDNSLPFLHFDGAAQGLFGEWRDGFEKRIRSGELTEAMEGHLAKFRKLVPTLALLNHLADGGEGPICHDALKRALAFAAYLETHAKRAYAAVTGTDADAARRILDHIRNGDLKDGFKARDIHQRDWSGLTDRERVGKGLELLADFDWIAPQAVGKNPAGGRPTTVYNINPRVKP